jgi:hypothetical protein
LARGDARGAPKFQQQEAEKTAKPSSSSEGEDEDEDEVEDDDEHEEEDEGDSPHPVYSPLSPDYSPSDDDVPPAPTPAAAPAPAPTPAAAPAPAPASTPAPVYGTNSPGNDPVISDLNEDSDTDMVANNNDSKEMLEEHVQRQLQQQEDEQEEQDARARREFLLKLNHEGRIQYAMLQERLRKRAEEDKEDEAIMLKAAYTHAQMRDAQGELGVRNAFLPGYIMTVPEIKKAYKQRMMQTHPDKGGNVEDSQRAKAAMNRLFHIEKYGLL